MTELRRVSPRHLRRQPAFTLIELLTVVAVIGILIAVLLGGYDSVRQRVLEAGCASQLRQIGAGVHGYVADNGGKLPVSIQNPGVTLPSKYYRTWATAIFPYVTGVTLSGTAQENELVLQAMAEKHFRCPADEAFFNGVDHGWSYGWNMACGQTIAGGGGTNYPQASTTSFPFPSRVFMVADAYHNASGVNYGTAVTDASTAAPPTNDPGTPLRHPYPRSAMSAEQIQAMPARRNLLYLDGHVAKAHITTSEIWRPLLVNEGLFEE